MHDEIDEGRDGDAEELLRRALLDVGSAVSVSLRIDQLPLSDAVTVIFYARLSSSSASPSRPSSSSSCMATSTLPDGMYIPSTPHFRRLPVSFNYRLALALD